MLKIYHKKNSRSVRVVWTAEEIGVPYELHHAPYDPADARSDEFLAASPFSTLPAIEDGGMRMAESGAICQYLTERYGRAPFKRAFGDPDYPAYLQWIHAGEATLAPPLIAIAQHTMMWPEAKRAPHVAVDAADTFRNRLQVLDRALTGRHFLLGSDMSAADVMVGYAFVLAGFFKLMGDAPPHVAAYWRRLQDRPAFQKAMSA